MSDDKLQSALDAHRRLGNRRAYDALLLAIIKHDLRDEPREDAPWLRPISNMTKPAARRAMIEWAIRRVPVKTAA